MAGTGRIRRWGLAVSFGLAVLLCVPTVAAAEGWLPFEFASPPKIEASETHVGVDGDGNVTAIWRNDPNITNTFGTLTISSALLPSGAAAYNAPLPVNATAGSGVPRIGVTENGNAVAVWERNDGSKDIVEGTTRTLSTWGGVTELTDAGDETAHYLTMALLPNGEGLVSWRVEGSPRKNKVRLINGGNFAPAPGKAFDTSPIPGNNEPDVALSADGSTRYLLGHKYDLGNTRLNIYTYSGAGPWDAGVEIAPSSGMPKIAVAPNGEVVTAWVESNKLKVKRGASPAVTVAEIGGSPLLELAVGPKTDEFPNGMVLVTWRQLVDDGSFFCCYQARAAVGTGVTMGPPIELSDELEDVANYPAIQAAIGPDGTAYTAWTRFDGDVWAVQASVRPPGDQFPGIADDITGTGDSVIRELITAADGRAIIAFDEIDSEGVELYWRAATAIYEPPPPPPEPVPAGPPAPPPGDTKAPKLKVNVSRKGFAPGDKLGQTAVERGKTSYVWKAVRKPLKEGTRLLVSLDEPATLTIRVDKLGCFTAKPGNPARNPSSQCFKRDPDVQHLRTSGKKGLNKITYLGSWAGGRVKPGALYEFEVIATDKAGNKAGPKRVHFNLDGKASVNGF